MSDREVPIEYHMPLDGSGELMVTIRVSETETITMPFLQVSGIGQCIRMIREKGGTPMWHRQECDCCYVVHDTPPEGQVMHSGYIVGPDGTWSWHEHTHPEDN